MLIILNWGADTLHTGAVLSFSIFSFAVEGIPLFSYDCVYDIDFVILFLSSFDFAAISIKNNSLSESYTSIGGFFSFPRINMDLVVQKGFKQSFCNAY